MLVKNVGRLLVGALVAGAVGCSDGGNGAAPDGGGAGSSGGMAGAKQHGDQAGKNGAEGGGAARGGESDHGGESELPADGGAAGETVVGTGGSGGGHQHGGPGGAAGEAGAGDEDEPLPIWWSEYQPTPFDVAVDTSSVAVLPRPAHIELGERSNCPHERTDLTAWDPAWLVDGVAQIPAGTKALLRGNQDIAADTLIRSLTIPRGSELVLDDRDTTLRVRDVTVTGALRLGSPTCRLQKHVEFVFDTDEDVTKPDVRGAIYDRMGLGIVVDSGGRLDVFGKLYQPTWTRLAATANKGATSLTLAEPVDWQAGQKVLVVNSNVVDYPIKDENEVRTLTANAAGPQLSLDQALAYPHYGGAEYQVEVGLLSRSIVFRTADAVLAAAPSFGGHIMVHDGHTRVSGAELYGMGQQNFLGRYPFHMHWAGDVERRSYFTDNSIWRSNFRCAVLHRTDRAVVSRNVAYDVLGHCYYLEDGVEEDNEVSFNLAARIKYFGTNDFGDPYTQAGIQVLARSDLINPADVAASGFYFPNGHNHILGNAASGGFAGFSFPNLPAPVGSNPKNVVPLAIPIDHFDGNTVHSSDYLWRHAGGVYVGGVLESVDDQGTQKLRYTSGRPPWQQTRTGGDLFSNTKAWFVASGITHWGQLARVINLEAVDSGALATLFGHASIEGALYRGRSGNWAPGYTAQQLYYWEYETAYGFQFYDTGTLTILSSVLFRDIPKAHCALESMTHSDQYTPQRMNATSKLFFNNIDDDSRFCHLNPNSGTLSSRNFNWNDEDGSGTALPGDGLPAGPRLVGSGYLDTWKTSAGCVNKPEWHLWICPRVGTQNTASVEVWPKAGTQVALYDLQGALVGNTYYAATDYESAQISGPSELGWHHSFPGGVPTSVQVHAKQVPDNSFVLFSFNVAPGAACKVNDAGWKPVADLPALLASTGAVYTTAQDTCFVRIPPTTAYGAFSAAGLTLPMQTYRGWSTLSAFTIDTGCNAQNQAACQAVVSKLPQMP